MPLTVNRRDARTPAAVGLSMTRTSSSSRLLSVSTPQVTRAAGWPKRTSSAACCVRGERVSAVGLRPRAGWSFPEHCRRRIRWRTAPAPGRAPRNSENRRGRRWRETTLYSEGQQARFEEFRGPCRGPRNSKRRRTSDLSYARQQTVLLTCEMRAYLAAAAGYRSFLESTAFRGRLHSDSDGHDDVKVVVLANRLDQAGIQWAGEAQLYLFAADDGKHVQQILGVESHLQVLALDSGLHCGHILPNFTGVRRERQLATLRF